MRLMLKTYKVYLYIYILSATRRSVKTSQLRSPLVMANIILDKCLYFMLVIPPKQFKNPPKIVPKIQKNPCI